MEQELGASVFPPGVFTADELKILEDLDKRQMTHDTVIPEAMPLIKIGEDIDICSGDILIFAARPKNQKTGSMGFLISGVIARSQDECYECIPYLSILPACYMHEGKRITKAVLHVDTEQGPRWHKLNQKQILARVGLTECPAFYKSCNFRDLQLDKFKLYVEVMCKAAAAKFDGIHILFLDGMADFVDSVNNENASQDIYRWFFKLADTYNCAIVASLHLNPGVIKKMRGHVGSDGERKADAVIQLEKKDGIVSWEASIMRGSENFPLIQTRYSKELGRHVYHGLGKKISDSDKQDIQTVKDKEKANTYAASVFKSDRPAILPAPEIKRLIMQGYDLSKAQARRIFLLMQEHGVIEPTESSGWKRKLVL